MPSYEVVMRRLDAAEREARVCWDEMRVRYVTPTPSPTFFSSPTDSRIEQVQDTPNNERTLQQLGIGRPYDKPDSSGLFNHNFRAGIEIEVEGMSSVEEKPQKWDATTDGSLRNGGREYITRNGFSGVDLERALTNMDKFFRDNPPTLSERCSTHIHIDVTDLTQKQIVNFLCLGVMMEHVLFSLFGNTRTANTFCLSTDTGTTNLYNIVAAMQKPEDLIHMTWSKYAAIGLKRIRDLGTVEFRMFSTVINKDDYVRILNTLFAMKAAAMEMESPQQLVDVKLTQGMSGIFGLYFPEVTYSEEYEHLLDRGAETLNDIITAAEVVRISSERAKKYKTIIKQADRLMREAQQGI